MTKNKDLTIRKVKEELFYWSICFLPVLTSLISWIFINGNSVLLTFLKYDENGIASFVGFENYKNFIRDFFTDEVMVGAIRNSLKIWILSVAATSVLPVLMSYYVFKKLPGSSAFKVIMYLPNIISGISLAIIWKFLCERVFPSWIGRTDGLGLLSDINTRLDAIIFYYIWMGYGSGLFIQITAMNSVDQSTLDAGYLDGCNFLQEFWHIVLPKSYGIITLGFVTGIGGIFSVDAGMYGYYGTTAHTSIQTMGYRFTILNLGANKTGYPYLATWGMCITLILAPLTLLAKKLINKIGPSED